MQGPVLVKYLLLLALPAIGCLSVPDGEAPMCHTTADCDGANGEICDQGVCWGNPPPGPFAAVVSPPVERNGDLVASELAVLPISTDGWLDELHLHSPVVYKGRIQPVCEAPVICDIRSLSATITVTRPSSFAGGPEFRTGVTVQAGDDSFEIKLPASGDGSKPFTMTVVPDGRDDEDPGTLTTAQLVPPLRDEINVPGNIGGKIIYLGGLGLPRISGTIQTNGGAPLEHYRVVAMGHWAADQPATEVSTVSYTGTDGKYSVTLSDGLVDRVEIVAKPFGLPLRPTLRLGNLLATQDAASKILSLPPQIGSAIAVDVVVEGLDNGGEVKTVTGAQVKITSTVTASTIASATLVATGTTNDLGVAKLKLLDVGAFSEAGYQISIVPPANAKAGAMFEELYTPKAVTTKRLPARVALSGVVHDIDGKPVKDIAVTVRPSLRFLWNLPSEAQTFVAGISPATATTPNTGEFVVFVDPQFTQVWGHYDLVFEPTSSGKLARVPSWSQPVELPRDASKTTVTLPAVTLPDASFVRGNVFDDQGELLEGAEVKLYRVPTDAALCGDVRYEPQSCPIPALLVGRGVSNDDGMVGLTLPR
jgi:hypothetical protein